MRQPLLVGGKFNCKMLVAPTATKVAGQLSVCKAIREHLRGIAQNDVLNGSDLWKPVRTKKVALRIKMQKQFLLPYRKVVRGAAKKSTGSVILKEKCQFS